MSGQYTIVRTTDPYDATDEDEATDETYLEMADADATPDGEPVAMEEVSVDDLVEMLDQDAEGANCHDFVGWAAKLADIVRTQQPLAADPEDMARRVLWAVAQLGGFTEGA